ncbi:uncharacterized protein B0I36DRAFT_329065 [Microdochium trichocladiopsis]|uniref:F-box domain-containing protein n=1 Tax=Microdochium trichocladiopsis TaxID=1682393 RepID=A0A9P9BLZ4_9PEZI|nr:uncharacterized protein B0I36DRAFT_329065 [Microdochium trichocladiopsis]KAH7025753.1 hypothetical protein B0I36DRAFT_329065 [Microdochium trichocladiopsis]
MATIEDLPREIFHEILQDLDLPSFARLKCASRRLNQFLRLEELPQWKRVQFMQAADRFPHNEDLLACYRCCKMLPRDSFGIGQRKGKRRKFGSVPARDRFCLGCAAANKLYGHMEAVVAKRGEEPRFLCHHCGRYGSRFQRCGPGAGEDGRWVCWSENTYGTPSLGGLPPEVIDRLVSQLSYKDAIHLSSSCAYLRKNVDYSHVSVESRFALVAGKDSEPNGTAGTQRTNVCYACFRVRPSEMFTIKQIYTVDVQRSRPYWQRRCRSCLYKMHANKDGNKALQSWLRQRPCDSCGTLKHEDTECQSFMCSSTHSASASTKNAVTATIGAQAPHPDDGTARTRTDAMVASQAWIEPRTAGNSNRGSESQAQGISGPRGTKLSLFETCKAAEHGPRLRKLKAHMGQPARLYVLRRLEALELPQAI